MIQSSARLPVHLPTQLPSVKLPSLHLIYQRAGEVLRRFPLVVLSGAAGAFAFAYQAHLTDGTTRPPDWVTQLFATSFLALPLTLSGYLLAERRRLSPARRAGLQGAGVALLVAYFLTLNADFDVVTSTRFGLFFVGVHLLVAIAPTPAQTNPNGFWQFNKVIFLRILLAGLYSVVLFAGTSLALLAVDNLFDVDVRGKWYSTVAALVFGVFNTCFFLAGVPENLDELGERDDYPRGLLVFTQFVLLPLVTLYLTILYFYAGKILVSQTLPKGWVSYLVIGFSVAGILSLLLVHPIRQRAENRWIGTFSRWFYLALFPLIGLLFVAIGERIRAYGITENRYFVLLLAGWLTGTALYFLVSQRKNIYWIPASLAILAFLASFGPWGAFRTAERSQLVRLDGLLRKNGLLDGGRIAAAEKAVPFRDNKQISSGLEFFANRNAAAVLQPYFARDLGDLLDTLNTYERRRELHKLAQIRYVNVYEEEGQDQQHYYSGSDLTDVAGFDYLIRIAADRQDLDSRGNRSGEQTYRYPYNNGRDSLLVRLDPTLTTLRFYRGNERLLDVNVGPKMAEILKNHPYADEAVAEPEMTLLVENERCRVRLRFSSLNVRTSGSGKVTGALNYTADALIDVK